MNSIFIISQSKILFGSRLIIWNELCLRTEVLLYFFYTFLVRLLLSLLSATYIQGDYCKLESKMIGWRTTAEAELYLLLLLYLQKEKTVNNFQMSHLLSTVTSMELYINDRFHSRRRQARLIITVIVRDTMIFDSGTIVS